MADSADPLRFLNLKKKKESNKQRSNLSIIALKEEKSKTFGNQFIVPSFSSLNSLEYEQTLRIKKSYNPLKYFNSDAEEYLNKLKRNQIINAPIMPSLELESPILEEKEKDIVLKGETISMMTFAKKNEVNSNYNYAETKIAFNFNKPGLRKSGSLKMMEKMKETLALNLESGDSNVPEISPWQMAENEGENQELVSCEICCRKFNPKSYEKHVKVCEKVFFKKRKPFNSRSNSQDHKMH